jgi:hypothetical protein
VDKRPKRPKDRSTSQTQKLSYKEKLELGRIVAEIEQAEARAAEIDAMLNDPDLYAARAEEVPAIVARQRELHDEIDRMMARWVELEGKNAG